jgi:ribonuclease III
MKEWLQKKLKIEPHQIELYEQAMTHASYAYEQQTMKNERLEFLGDAVLGILMTDYFYRYDTSDEGTMSKRKAKAVSEEALGVYASHIQLKKQLKLGKGEAIKGANIAMIADAFEALLGAVYLDLGFDAVSELFKRIVVPYIDHALEIRDYKSALQEYIHTGDKRNISYHVIKETGPSHDKAFEVVVKLDKQIMLGYGKGKTKKEAEQNAAQDALKKGNYDFKETL